MSGIKPYKRNRKLEDRMGELRVTGALLSYSTGIQESKISKIKMGRTKASKEEKVLIAETLECEVEEIFNNGEENDNQ